MTSISILRSTAIVMACCALSACLGNGGGGTGVGAGGGGTQAEYDAELSRIQQIAPSSVKHSGTFDYQGQTLLETQDSAGTANGYMLGDVTATVNYDAETASGEATNFRGEVGGETVELTGTLDTNNAVGGNVASTPPTTIAGQTIVATSVMLNMEGTLSNAATNDTADVAMLMGGAVLGPNAEAIHGASVATSTQLNGQIGLEGFGGGTVYLEKQ